MIGLQYDLNIVTLLQLTSGANSPLMIRSCKRIQRSVPARTSCLKKVNIFFSFFFKDQYAGDGDEYAP